MTINITDQTRALPLWRTAQDEGQHIGLRLALEILTREATRQEDRAKAAQKENPLEVAAAQHNYAAHVLLDAAKLVAARFRA